MRVLYVASRVGAARVGVPTYARNRAGRRDLGRRQVNTPLTYAFFPLVPFALSSPFLVIPSLFFAHLSLSLSPSHTPALFLSLVLLLPVHVSPNLYRLPISLSTLPERARVT